MAIEIRELVIRAVVDAPARADDVRGQELSGDAGDRAALIQTCVSETLKILRARRER